MDLELGEHVVAITGGSDGLGLALAARLVGEGARVAICGRDPDRLAAAVDSLGTGGPGRAIGVQADVRVPGDAERLLEAAWEQWGRLDGLVNNAGVHAAGPFAEITDREWEADLDLKVFAVARTIRAALPHLTAGGGGAILNTLNVFAKAPAAGTMPTSVARAAGMAMTKALSKEMASQNVRSNAIVVGFVDSGQLNRLAEETNKPNERLHQELVERFEIPLGRVGAREEFADLAAFLLSPRAAYITGAAVNLDGGLCAVV